MNIDYRILAISIGYCIGLIQSAYIVGKLVRNIDIREHGSGNAGAANTLRTMGFRAGVTVLIADAAKAVLAFAICAIIWNGGGTFFGEGSVIPGLYGAVGAILGHCFPFYLKFRGGKGFASTIGLMISINIWILLIAVGIGAIMVLTTRYVSLFTLEMTAAMPIGFFLFGYPVEVIIISSLVAILIWYLHRANISRLLKGEENRFEMKNLIGK